MVFSGRLSLELCENEHTEGNQKKAPGFWSQEKDSSPSNISSRTDGKKKTRHFLLHTWHYTKRCVRTALPLDSQGVLKYV